MIRSKPLNYRNILSAALENRTLSISTWKEDAPPIMRVLRYLNFHHNLHCLSAALTAINSSGFNKTLNPILSQYPFAAETNL